MTDFNLTVNNSTPRVDSSKTKNVVSPNDTQVKENSVFSAYDSDKNCEINANDSIVNAKLQHLMEKLGNLSETSIETLTKFIDAQKDKFSINYDSKKIGSIDEADSKVKNKFNEIDQKFNKITQDLNKAQQESVTNNITNLEMGPTNNVSPEPQSSVEPQRFAEKNGK